MLRTKNPGETRQSLLKAAYDEIYRNGFRSASLDNILSNTGVTKGALYHHFKNKTELGYAVVDELIKKSIIEEWVTPFMKTEDPISSFIDRLKNCKMDGDSLQCGCPLNNLAQEMSPHDEGFRERINQAFQLWRDGISSALVRGQSKGTVRSDINADRAASFILAVFEGGVSLSKSKQNCESFDICCEGLIQYLESLRPLGKRGNFN